MRCRVVRPGLRGRVRGLHVHAGRRVGVQVRRGRDRRRHMHAADEAVHVRLPRGMSGIRRVGHDVRLLKVDSPGGGATHQSVRCLVGSRRVQDCLVLLPHSAVRGGGHQRQRVRVIRASRARRRALRTGPADDDRRSRATAELHDGSPLRAVVPVQDAGRLHPAVRAPHARRRAVRERRVLPINRHEVVQDRLLRIPDGPRRMPVRSVRPALNAQPRTVRDSHAPILPSKSVRRCDLHAHRMRPTTTRSSWSPFTAATRTRSPAANSASPMSRTS